MKFPLTMSPVFSSRKKNGVLLPEPAIAAEGKDNGALFSPLTSVSVVGEAKFGETEEATSRFGSVGV